MVYRPSCVARTEMGRGRREVGEAGRRGKGTLEAENTAKLVVSGRSEDSHELSGVVNSGLCSLSDVRFQLYLSLDGPQASVHREVSSFGYILAR